MLASEQIETASAMLRRRCRGDVSSEPLRAAEFERDFGGIARKRPALVLRPAGIEDVLAALEVASELELSVTTRGSGHGQGGQSLGESLLLDMRGLARVHAVDVEQRWVDVDAGTTWKTLVDRSFAHGLMPTGLTQVLDTTVAGTLSIAGVGGESWRFGPQADCVESFDVATMGGTLFRASATENRELFDATRAGLGQCGVILRARFPLRQSGRRIRTHCFAYSSVESFIADLPLACEEGATRLVVGAVTRDPLFSARLVILLFVGRDYDDEADLQARPLPAFCGREVPPSQDAPFWNVTGVPGHLFFRLFAPAAGSLDADPTSLHPWVDHIFAPERAGAALEALFSRGARALAKSKLGIVLMRRGPSPAPLFAVPADAGLLFGIGMFCGFPDSARAEALEVMSEYLDSMEPLGGKRYLSGWIPSLDPLTWRKHYGCSWDAFARAKRHYDPKRLLNPGFITWDDP